MSRGDQRAGAGHRLDAQAGRNGGLHDAFARIADARTARVRDQRDFFAAPQAFDDFLAALRLVELEIAQQRLGNSEMLQQLSGVPRVLGRHHVALLERAQRAQRDVLQVADRRGDQVKRAGRQRWRFHALT